MEPREVNQIIARLLDTLEQHGLMKVTELIDGNRLDEACKVVDILRGVGVV